MNTTTTTTNVDRQEGLDMIKNKRDQYVGEIRKQKKKQVLQNKRARIMNMTEGNENQEFMGQLFQNKNLTACEQLQELAQMYGIAKQRNDFNEVCRIVKGIRLVMSFDDTPPCAEFQETGLCPEIISLINYDNFNKNTLIQDCMWILCNFASQQTKYATYLVDHKVEKLAMNLLDHDDENIVDCALYFLSNIAGDAPEYKMLLVEEYNIIPKICNLVNQRKFDLDVIRDFSWLISNLLKKPYLPFEDVACLLDFINFTLNLEDPGIQENTLWSISYLCDESDEQISEVVRMEIVPRILQILKTTNKSDVGKPALRALGNIVTGFDDDTEFVLQLGIIDVLAPLLDSSVKYYRKEAAWAFSNILAGPSEHISQVEDYGNGQIFRRLFSMAYSDEVDVRFESIYAICHSCESATSQQIQARIDDGIYELIISIFDEYNDDKLLISCIDSLTCIFSFGEAVSFAGNQNPFVAKFCSLGGDKVIEDLQGTCSDNVYEYLTKFMDKFWEQ